MIFAIVTVSPITFSCPVSDPFSALTQLERDVIGLRRKPAENEATSSLPPTTCRLAVLSILSRSRCVDDEKAHSLHSLLLSHFRRTRPTSGARPRLKVCSVSFILI